METHPPVFELRNESLSGLLFAFDRPILCIMCVKVWPEHIVSPMKPLSMKKDDSPDII